MSENLSVVQKQTIVALLKKESATLQKRAEKTKGMTMKLGYQARVAILGGAIAALSPDPEPTP